MPIPDCPACKGTGLVTIRPAERQFNGETHEQSCSCSRLATLRTPLTECPHVPRFGVSTVQHPDPLRVRCTYCGVPMFECHAPDGESCPTTDLCGNLEECCWPR